MKIILLICWIALFCSSCRDKATTSDVESTGGLKVYRCYSVPVVGIDEEDPLASLEYTSWEIAADKVCRDDSSYSKLKDLVLSCPVTEGQDFPFVGYSEHYMLVDDAEDVAYLIGIIDGSYGFVVWEMEVYDGAWCKTDRDWRRGKNGKLEDLRAILKSCEFSPL